MRAIIQRVSSGSVVADGHQSGAIAQGLLVLLGIEENDTQDDLTWLAAKIVNMRIFGDDEGLMNFSLKEVGGRILLISQFTLHASTKKGNRPSFIRAARPEHAVPLYEGMIAFLDQLMGEKTETGVFGADMQVSLVNDGPVTIFIDSRNRE